MLPAFMRHLEQLQQFGIELNNNQLTTLNQTVFYLARAHRINVYTATCNIVTYVMLVVALPAPLNVYVEKEKLSC